MNLKRWQIILLLVAVAFALGTLGSVVHTQLSESWLSVLNISVSGVLSAALVILYFRQTTILESQRNLLTQELNREARQQHTETLRDRVRIWHGNPDREMIDEPFGTSELNMPRIKASSFKSAPWKGDLYMFAEEDYFSVVPSQLKNDRYLEDLLENHAPDLRKTKEAIECLYEEFQSIRDDFEQNMEVGAVKETDKYTIERDEILSQWIFQLLVKEERGLIGEEKTAEDLALNQLQEGGINPHREKDGFWIRIDKGGGTRMGVYMAKMKVYDDDYREYHSSAKRHAVDALREEFDNIDESRKVELVSEAAKILDEAAGQIAKLERLLIEYEGKPIYSGECDYLEEAKIKPES